MTDTNSGSGVSAWSDEDFLRAFEDLSLPAELFHHREHVRVAWLYLKSSDATRAAERMAAGILRFANHHGATQKYRHTVTLAWVRLVAAALVETPDGYNFEQFLGAHRNSATKIFWGNTIPSDCCKVQQHAKAGSRPDLQPLPTLRVYRCC